jgi:antitoxin (DNA-binding transcriptional repressor) of toxin-antitoxin stability system
MKPSISMPPKPTSRASWKRPAKGAEIIIAMAGKPVACLVAVERPDFRKSFGILKGKIWVSDDFDAPWPPEIL